MDRETFFTGHPMFKKALSGVKPSKSDSMKNLLEFRDKYLFVWCAEESALLVADVNSEEQTYQTLRLLTTPCFSVERACVSVGCARACVWGARGAVVIELPRRLAPSGVSASAAVPCKSFTLDERFLLSQAEVRRARWHPVSPSVLILLVSDNTIRLYNMASKSSSKLTKCISIGPRPSSRLAGRPVLESLGDTAVDFDCVPGTDKLLALRGNGDVYTVCVGDDGDSRVRGPLCTYPPADDNYGSDSCSILVLGSGRSAPHLVVIATCSALLYHALLLPDDAHSASVLNTTEGQRPSDLALFVLECVELDVDLFTEEALRYSYPVHLYPIGEQQDRYVCAHAAGVHSVTLPVMAAIKEFAAVDDNETEGVLCGALSRCSVARYLVRTRAPAPALCALPAPAMPSLLVLLDDAAPLLRELEPLCLEDQIYASLQQNTTNPAFQKVYSLLKEREKMSFSSIIQDILTRGVSQPILKMAVKKEPSPKEAIELLAEATMKLSSEYMSKQERASEVIQSKLRDVSSLGAMQAEWLRQLQKQGEELTTSATNLRGRCARAIENYARLRNRCWRVMRQLRSDCAPSPAERALLSELRALKDVANSLRRDVATLKHVAGDEKKLKELKEENERKAVLLGKSHSETISSVLHTQSVQLSSIIEETKLLKDQLSIA